MKEEVILMLSELRSQINDAIIRVEKESSANGKEMVSMLMCCGFVDVYDLLGEETSRFLEYMEDCGFVKTKRESINILNRHPIAQNERVSVHNWIEFIPCRGWRCHPALIALYKNNTENGY